MLMFRKYMYSIVIIHIYVIYTLEDIHITSSFPDGVDLTVTFVLKIKIYIIKLIY